MPAALWRGASAARGADHQAAWNAPDAVLLRAADHRDQACAGLLTELVQVHVDGGQRRPAGLGDDLPVVEPDHGDVGRNTHPALPERVDHAARDLVAAAEDRVD